MIGVQSAAVQLFPKESIANVPTTKRPLTRREIAKKAGYCSQCLREDAIPREGLVTCDTCITTSMARRGLVPEACSSWFLPRIVGISRAMEWVATGRVFGAAEAMVAGLVRSVHQPADLLPAARALAEEIAANTSPVAVALSRQMMWRMLGADHPMEAHKIDSRGVFAQGRGGDVKRGRRVVSWRSGRRSSPAPSPKICLRSFPGGPTARYE